MHSSHLLCLGHIGLLLLRCWAVHIQRIDLRVVRRRLIFRLFRLIWLFVLRRWSRFSCNRVHLYYLLRWKVRLCFIFIVP